jgi:hypothetical protein
MPGISPECDSGHHQACAERPMECRCPCHMHTQELLRKQVVEKQRGPKAVPRGRARRIPEVARPPIDVKAEAHEELQNTCETCGLKHPSTKHFCTQCGSKLCLGQYCQRCEAPCDALDKFCGECGWNLKSPISAPEPTVTTVRSNPMPDMTARLSLPPVEGDPTNGKPAPLPPGIVVGFDVPVEPKEQTEPEDPLLRLVREAEAKGLKPTFGVRVSE